MEAAVCAAQHSAPLAATRKGSVRAPHTPGAAQACRGMGTLATAVARDENRTSAVQVVRRTQRKEASMVAVPPPRPCPHRAHEVVCQLHVLGLGPLDLQGFPVLGCRPMDSSEGVSRRLVWAPARPAAAHQSSSMQRWQLRIVDDRGLQAAAGSGRLGLLSFAAACHTDMRPTLWVVAKWTREWPATRCTTSKERPRVGW